VTKTVLTTWSGAGTSDGSAVLPLTPAETLARKVALRFAFDFGIVEAAAAVMPEMPAEGVVP
jgi:hypothetical protein